MSTWNERAGERLRRARPSQDASAELRPRSGSRLVSFYEGKPRRSGEGVDQLEIYRADGFTIAGPVIANVVYVTHPSDPQSLIPFADFDETLAKEKLEEALRVFTALGASRVVATANRVEASKASVGYGRRRVAMNVAAGRNTGWQLAVDQRGKGGSPVDPRPLRFNDISGLDSACEVVLRNGGSHFKIEIESKTQFGVDGTLAGRLKKAGFTISLSAERTRHNQFIIEAVFGEDAAPQLDAVVAATLPAPNEASGSFMNWIKRRSGQ